MVGALVLVDLLVEDLAHGEVVFLDGQQVLLGELGPVEEVHDQLAVFGLVGFDVDLGAEEGVGQVGADAFLFGLLQG